MSFRYDEIGQRLKAFRLASGMSADEIARRIDISRTALYRFERGELAKIETLEKLAELLDVSIPTLLALALNISPRLWHILSGCVSLKSRLSILSCSQVHCLICSHPNVLMNC